MIELNCPCCGKSMGPVVDPTKIPMSPVRQTIVKRLPATVEQIANAVYGSRNNSPSAQYQSLRVTINNLRKLLKPYGWTINDDRPGRGNSKVYYLARCSAE